MAEARLNLTPKLTLSKTHTHTHAGPYSLLSVRHFLSFCFFSYVFRFMFSFALSPTLPSSSFPLSISLPLNPYLSTLLSHFISTLCQFPLLFCVPFYKLYSIFFYLTLWQYYSFFSIFIHACSSFLTSFYLPFHSISFRVTL